MKSFIISVCILACSFTGLKSQELMRGPYLQSLATSSIKVLWRTSVPTTGMIEVSTAFDGSNIIFSSEEDSAKIDHNILVESLNPGNLYYYRVGSVDGGYLTDWSRKYQFKTSSDEISKLSFWVTGDFGAKSLQQIKVRDAFINYAGNSFPDFWLWLGDNAYNEGTDAQFQERVFSKPYGYDSLLTFLPFYPVPGNHEYKSVTNVLAPPPARKAPYFTITDVPTNGEAGGVASNNEIYYSFDYGNAHFVALNSEEFAYTFFSTTVMTEWLREDLKASDKLFKVVYFHQPPYSKGSHDSDDFQEVYMKAMRKNFTPIMEHFGVDLVLSGHSHVYERSHLIKGHTGTTGTFDESMFIDNEAPYMKYLDGDQPNDGTMYIVVGNSGKATSTPPGGHPIFGATDYGPNKVGSLVVEIEDNVLKGTYIRGDSTIGDEFTITKALMDSTVTAIGASIITEFNIYPNPTKGNINIQFSISTLTSLSFFVYDEAGKMVHQEENLSYEAGNHIKRMTLGKRDLSSGNYIVKVANGNNQSWMYEKVIKIK